MNKEHARRWLAYKERGQNPTRVKLNAVVYSDQSIATPIHFKLNDFEMTLSPLQPGQIVTSSEGGLMPAFACETIIEAERYHGSSLDLYECLDRVLPLVGFKYRLPIEFDKWEEYDGQWLESIGGGGRVSFLSTHGKMPKANIQALVHAYEKVSLRKDKRSKKAALIRKRLKEALELEDVSPRFSFMSYYSIIEIISDDLAANNDVPSNDSVAVDMARHALTGSQRSKIYFLLRALENDFDRHQQMELADIRNNLAHGQFELERPSVEACKKIAVWASEKYILHLATTAA